MASNSASSNPPLALQRIQKAFYTLGTVVLLAIALYWGHVFLVPLALATLFAFILSTPAAWLEKHGLRRVIGVLLVTLGAFAVLGAVVTVATWQIRGLATEMPRYQQNIERKVQPVQGFLQRLRKFQSHFEDASPTPPATEPSADSALQSQQPLPVVLRPSQHSSLSWLPGVAMPLVETLVTGVLVTVLTVFMLMRRESFRDRLIRLAGRRRLSSTTRALDDAANRIGQYLRLQLAVNATLGAVSALGLYLLKVPYSPLWGLLICILRFVPYVGYWIAALAATAMSAAVSEGWGHPLIVLVMFATFDLVLANVIEPLLFGHGTGVSPVALLIAAVFWAFLWGPVGLLLSTPLTVCLAVLGKHVPMLGFLAILLGDDPHLEPASRLYNRLLARDFDDAAVQLDEFAADHSPEETYDQIILPTLAQAKTDREQGEIDTEEEHAIYDAARWLLEGNTAAGRVKKVPIDGLSPTEPADARPPVKEREGPAANTPLAAVNVVGCAVAGEADSLALRMLKERIKAAGGTMESATPQDLQQKLDQSTASDPPSVCFAVFSPGGLAQARAMLHETRTRHPQARLLVARWGQTGDTELTEKYLHDSGADAVSWSLRQTLQQLMPHEKQGMA